MNRVDEDLGEPVCRLVMIDAAQRTNSSFGQKRWR
jgi:hypothetical protein